MATTNENAIVLNFNDSLLRQSDVDLLEGPYWINDKLISFCFEYFEKEKFNHSADKLALISPEIAQFIKLAPGGEHRVFGQSITRILGCKALLEAEHYGLEHDDDLDPFLEPLNLPSKEFIFIPVNDNNNLEAAGGTHWSLLVYMRNKQEFRHYDSLDVHNKEVARMLAYKLQPYVKAPRGRMKVIEADSPKQANGYDCGMFVISNAEHLCRELCEGYNIPLNDVVHSQSVSEKRSQIKELIFNVAQEFGT